MQCVFIVTDTNIFRYIVEAHFQDKFLETCQTLSIKIVTLIQIEREVRRHPACQQLFNLLNNNGTIHQYTTPERFKSQENDMYRTLKAVVDDADAAVLPVAILNDWILHTNDDEAISIFAKSFPALFPKLKLMSFESFLYLAYQKSIIDEEEGENIVADYKNNCFASPDRQNRKIRGRNFLELVTFLHEQGVSPVKYFS
jgi:hypothetical protein